MRIDVVTIFPDYLAPLRLSLVGRAIADGLLALGVHDLRAFTRDRHRTVDDAPYGGGPGMLMKPEPWGDALDHVLADAAHDAEGSRPVLIVTSPAGRRFDQAMAAELAAATWLVFACGRYEGIDDRVVQHYRGRGDVREVSIGDYVLAGGEAAALVMIEAIVRLLPGVLGNADSAHDDSFAAGPDGLLEAPAYTRPPTWRGLSVPPVLMSGDHGAVAAWRRAQSKARTAQQRPDLLRRPDADSVRECGIT